MTAIRKFTLALLTGIIAAAAASVIATAFAWADVPSSASLAPSNEPAPPRVQRSLHAPRTAAARLALQNMSCVNLPTLLANASEITVATAQPSPRRSWFPLQEAMHMPLFPGLHRRRSCALIGSHPRALVGMTKHRAAIMRTDAVVILNRANATFIASILRAQPGPLDAVTKKGDWLTGRLNGCELVAA